jgi:hypothetical protein
LDAARSDGYRFAAVRGFVALVLCLAALAGAAAASGSRSADEITFRVDARFDPGIGTRNISFSGRVSSGAAGEVVEIQAKECGRNRFYRLIAGTRTLGGGSFALPNQTGFGIPQNAYFRARWKGNYSNVVLVRVPLVVWARWNPRRRTVRVSVTASSTGYSLRGRYVELQRDAGGGEWVTVRRARLSQTKPAGFFATVFSVPTRGLTLRVFAPDATGAPCFRAGASDTWRS